jgi:hypothetical protein
MAVSKGEESYLVEALAKSGLVFVLPVTAIGFGREDAVKYPIGPWSNTTFLEWEPLAGSGISRHRGRLLDVMIV